MDIEQAKFILSSFRPDGADAHDPAFADALSLAAEDRQLGEWLAQERARDAAFAAALNNIEIPADLRDAIHHILTAVENQTELAHEELDTSFISALSHISPPAGLRDQILAAMEIEKETIVRPAQSKFSSRPWGWISGIAAAAAVLVISFIFLGPGANQATASTSPQEITQTAIDQLSSPEFKLDLKNPEQAALYEWLKSNELPAPDELPPGLMNIPGLGCKKLQVGNDKIPASLICFRKGENQVVHLVVIKKENLDADLDGMICAGDNCYKCNLTGWSHAKWSNDKNAFFLLAKCDAEQLVALF